MLLASWVKSGLALGAQWVCPGFALAWFRVGFGLANAKKAQFLPFNIFQLPSMSFNTLNAFNT
jgi:hypothetical protein